MTTEKFDRESFLQIYDETDLQRAKLELLSSTNMVDFAMDIHKSLYPDQVVPAELPERRSRVVSELKRLQVSWQEIIFYLLHITSVHDTLNV